MGDILQALNRIRPGREFTLPATGTNQPAAGDCIKFTFTTSASAEQVFRFSAIAGGGGAGLPPIYVSIKVTADCHVLFGPAGGVPTPTNASALYQPADSWQDYQLNPGDTSFKVKGDTAGGDLYVVLTSR